MMIYYQMPPEKMDIGKLILRIQNDELDRDTVRAIRVRAVDLSMDQLIGECDKKLH